MKAAFNRVRREQERRHEQTVGRLTELHQRRRQLTESKKMTVLAKQLAKRDGDTPANRRLAWELDDLHAQTLKRIVKIVDALIAETDEAARAEKAMMDEMRRLRDRVAEFDDAMLQRVAVHDDAARLNYLCKTVVDDDLTLYNI